MATNYPTSDTNVATINFDSRKLAEHEVMIEELLKDENLAGELVYDENMVATNMQAVTPECLLQTPRSDSYVTPPRHRTPKPFSVVNTSLLTPPVTPRTNVDSKEKKSIATLVFFDLETTGLPHEIGKANVQITELSLVAMKRKEFEKCASSDLKDVRVINKLSMCFQPRSSVSRGAAKITGLDNSNLNDCPFFDHNAATTILSFLGHLPKPVCLLAHNGKTFDYPILKSELRRNRVQLPSDILIADTLLGIRDSGIPVFPPTKKVCKSVKFKNGQVSYGLENLHLFFFNKKPVGSHSSEGDCIALAKVCHFIKDTMLPWLDENSTYMELVQPMW